MKNLIYLRPLTLKDAETSYKWRNNPNLWNHSKFDPSTPITMEMEQNWISNILNRENECRRAIVFSENDEYVGNVQVIQIDNGCGEFHLFIGEERYWGMGIGKEATRLILNHVFSVLNLNQVTLEVHIDNKAAQAIYRKIGFTESGVDEDYIEMRITKHTYVSCTVSSDGELIN